jgi:hypothetical protein
MVEPHPREEKKRVYELIGPCGRLLAQGRTPDQARGVYLARFPSLPRDLDIIQVVAKLSNPTEPYCVLHRCGRLAVAVVRYP